MQVLHNLCHFQFVVNFVHVILFGLYDICNRPGNMYILKQYQRRSFLLALVMLRWFFALTLRLFRWRSAGDQGLGMPIMLIFYQLDRTSKVQLNFTKIGFAWKNKRQK